ncbi:MAG: penicillin acylase family protein [Dokdonella sp.]
MSLKTLRRSIGRGMFASCVLLGLSAPLSAQTLIAPGMTAPGSISYNAEGVPTISAANDNDAAFLQGYAHAKDRFYQMDYTRRAVSGTLAELLGPAALSSDVQTRTLGLRRGAERTWRALSDDMRGWMLAYSNGVNYWLANAALPPEYGALDLTRATPWSPVDSIVVGKGLAFQLSFDLDIDPTIRLGTYQAAAAAAGLNATALYFNDIFRAAPFDDRVSVPGFQPSASAAASASVAKVAERPTADGPIAEVAPVDPQVVELAKQYRNEIKGNPLLQRALEGHDSPIGSNEWAVSGSRTASGKAILSNDPHLSLGLPPVFAEQHVYSADTRYPQPMDVTGVTVPGAPGVIQGCNQSMCWGTTTNSLDVTDVFNEKLRLNSYGLPYAIVHDGVDEPIQWLFQNYYVNQLDGTPDNIVRNNAIGYTNGGVTLIVPRRNNGPILSLSGTTGLSVAYTGWGATKELESFRRINRAATVNQFKDALTYFDFGSQNFVYSDTAGNIAYFTSGEAPVRADLQAGTVGGGVPPTFIRDGTGAAKHDWLPVSHPQPNQATPYEVLPASEMPFVVNPASGYVANANNDPIGFSLTNNPLTMTRPGGGIYYLDGGGSSSLRMGRIDRELQRLIASGNPITAADMRTLQANTQSLDAELLMPYLLAAYDRSIATGAWADAGALATNAKVAEAISRLRAWDFSMPTGIQQGYDGGDNPNALPMPSQQEIANSVAATIYATFRAAALRNTIEAALTRIGLANNLPGGGDSLKALKYQLDNYAVLHGKGASGINFFAATGAPDAEAARDFLLLKSVKDGLNRLASADFSAAFARSTNLANYRWGRLHRITFKHSLGGPFNIPGPNPYPFQDLTADLPGLARDGGYETVNVAAHNIRADSVNGFMFGSGPARRFVGEMANPIEAGQIIPGGPSGVVGSPFYVSQLSRWLTANYKPLPISQGAALVSTVTTINFTP